MIIQFEIPVLGLAITPTLQYSNTPKELIVSFCHPPRNLHTSEEIP
jgi:hypothetical protein